MSGHTPGPWYADRDGNIWRRNPADLYQNGGSVAGDRPLASAHRGWYGADEAKFPVDANARLIKASPELLAFADRVYRQFHDAVHAGSVESSLRDAARDLIEQATGATP